MHLSSRDHVCLERNHQTIALKRSRACRLIGMSTRNRPIRSHLSLSCSHQKTQLLRSFHTVCWAREKNACDSILKEQPALMSVIELLLSAIFGTISLLPCSLAPHKIADCRPAIFEIAYYHPRSATGALLSSFRYSLLRQCPTLPTAMNLPWSKAGTSSKRYPAMNARPEPSSPKGKHNWWDDDDDDDDGCSIIPRHVVHKRDAFCLS